MVGVIGFEPTTTGIQDQDSIHTELHPEKKVIIAVADGAGGMSFRLFPCLVMSVRRTSWRKP